MLLPTEPTPTGAGEAGKEGDFIGGGANAPVSCASRPAPYPGEASPGPPWLLRGGDADRRLAVCVDRIARLK